MKFRKIEFWAATAFLVLFIYIFIEGAQSIMAYNGPYSYIGMMGKKFRESGLEYDYFINSLYPDIAFSVAIYLAFVFLNNYVIPSNYPQKKYQRMGLLGLLAYLFTLTVFSLAHYYQGMYQRPDLLYYFIENISIVMLVFGIYFLYAVIKKILEYYLLDPEKKHSLFSKILRETLITAAVWMAVFIWIMTAGIDSFRAWGPLWIGLVPYAYCMYQVNLYRLIPRYEKSNKKLGLYLALLLFFAVLLFVPFLFILVAMEAIFGSMLIFVSWICFTLISVGVAFLVYQRNKERINQLVFLEKELGKASSNLQFLRSQINPHFLFNALNTLYGASLRENAEKTGEGIQKLGDMMRFMLHENHQDTISLPREIDYLNDYIHLQKLRLAQSELISIEVNINETDCQHSIAPMLLIPFVENAFKHGISLQKRSWIKITMHCDQNHLYFDVGNSIHRKNGMDTERKSKGIGLENVKRRLGILYPEKHKLTIHGDESEYTVHLTINLS